VCGSVDFFVSTTAYNEGMRVPLSNAWTRRVRVAAVFLAAYVLDGMLGGPLLFQSWLFDLLSQLPPGMMDPLVSGYELTLRFATLVVILSVVGRALGIRKGSWAMAARSMPTLVHKILHLVPGVLWFVFAGGLGSLRLMLEGNEPRWAAGLGAGVLLGAIGMTALTRFAIKRATSAVHETPTSVEAVNPAETVFSAVAVTWTTRVAVAAMALLPVAFLTALLNVRIGDVGLAAALATYIATALGSVALLRRVSRIKVGIDGVYVMGSGPATFYAWSSVDQVRADGVDVMLRRRGKVVLRLQLHGADQTRSGALAVRFADAMAAAELARDDPSHVHAAHAVSAAAVGNDRFLASTHGATDYRQAAVPRDQLWEVVEGAAAEPSARVLAAEALATSALDADDRARLRIAAEHCAEPRVRIALEDLLDEDDAPAEAHERDLQACRRKTLERPRGAGWFSPRPSEAKEG
jgi:hypothetical protein